MRPLVRELVDAKAAELPDDFEIRDFFGRDLFTVVLLLEVILLLGVLLRTKVLRLLISGGHLGKDRPHGPSRDVRALSLRLADPDPAPVGARLGGVETRWRRTKGRTGAHCDRQAGDDPEEILSSHVLSP